MAATRDELLTAESVNTLRQSVEQFTQEARRIGANMSVLSAERFLTALALEPCPITIGHAGVHMADIESRFSDEIGFTRWFVLPPDQVAFLGGASDLLGQEAATLYPSIWFDMEEASKCVAFGRFTACVFHSMRVLEVGIRALERSLKLPEAVRASDRSWHKALARIKDAIDVLPATENGKFNERKTFYEAMYASLDAIKNPWRNATMHVEGVYSEDQAKHILFLTASVVKRLSEQIDEQGDCAENSVFRLLS